MATKEDFKKLPDQSGIYLIKNPISNKYYVGQAVNIQNRFCSNHYYDYKNENNSSYNAKLYQAVRKYGGWDVFEVSVLELCSKELLDEKEIYYISLYDSYAKGYNSTKGGQYVSEKLFSDETEEKRRQTREQNQSLKGENHPRAKLSNDEVIQIRQRYIDGEDLNHIYIDYQNLYSKSVFADIVYGRTYKSVGNIPKKENIRHTNGKLTANQVREIRRLYHEEHKSQKIIGEIYNMSQSAIGHILQGKTYKHVQ